MITLKKLCELNELISLDNCTAFIWLSYDFLLYLSVFFPIIVLNCIHNNSILKRILKYLFNILSTKLTHQILGFIYNKAIPKSVTLVYELLSCGVTKNNKLYLSRHSKNAITNISVKSANLLFDIPLLLCVQFIYVSMTGNSCFFNKYEIL